MMKMNQTKIVFSLLVFSFFLRILLNSNITVVAQNTRVIPVKVGVVLDLDTLGGQMGLSCINMSLSDFYASHGNFTTRLNLNVRNSKGDVVGAASSAHSSISTSDLCSIAKCPLDEIETLDCSSFHCPQFYYACGDGSIAKTKRRKGEIPNGVFELKDLVEESPLSTSRMPDLLPKIRTVRCAADSPWNSGASKGWLNWLEGNQFWVLLMRGRRRKMRVQSVRLWILQNIK
ncbi:hypothetical protein RJ641_022058 [Dillenia turbinata]|uniref:Uncharacterized protein n=1 Tax=Dillenia turbinata TaxID=194707 RepID=A0AAN8UL27_9MAGN